MIRLILAGLLLLVSLLTVFRAPTYHLWMAAVAITNYSQYFFIASFLLLASCFFTGCYRIGTGIVSLLSTLLFLVPVLVAYVRGSHLQKEIAASFPSTVNKGQLEIPFSFRKIFTGIGKKEIVPFAIEYKAGLNLDFYASQTVKNAPCIIVVHGGSWQSGDRKELPDFNSYFASHGYHVASIDYRFAPKYKCPAQVEDVKDAISFLSSKSEILHIDTSNFILVGRSAGGQIATLAAYSLKNKNIKGAVSFYAPNDMVWGGDKPGNPLVMNTDKVLSGYIGGSFKEAPEKFAACSPAEFVNQNSTPTLIIHGSKDALVSYTHSVRLNNKLESFKVPHYFLNIPFATHACDYNISSPAGQLCIFSIERFINSVTAWKN